MASLEDIVASLTDRLRSLELENQALQQGTRPESIREPKAALPDKFDGSRRHFRGFKPDIDWNDAALRSQFYSGLSSEIKDHLVHCESPVSLAAAMDQAIRIDNRIFERRQEQQYNPRQFRRNQPPNTTRSSQATLSSTNSDLLITTVDLQQINLLLRSLQLPSNNIGPLMIWISISLAVAL
ncbi:hypothetical protein BASA83_011960 [Batrachochytrium salamandrivorans]|nr:hypothetical protein BASA83_011960 [Batrachochytrium salamandrivorans]